MSDTSDFYEDDEPVEKVREAFDREEKGVTAKRPRDLNRLAPSIVRDATGMVATPEPVRVSSESAGVTFVEVRFGGDAVRLAGTSKVTITR